MPMDKTKGINELYQCDLTFMPVKLNLTLVNADRTNK